MKDEANARLSASLPFNRDKYKYEEIYPLSFILHPLCAAHNAAL